MTWDAHRSWELDLPGHLALAPIIPLREGLKTVISPRAKALAIQLRVLSYYSLLEEELDQLASRTPPERLQGILLSRA